MSGDDMQGVVVASGESNGIRWERISDQSYVSPHSLTIHPADPLSDPRVVALVEAARSLLFAHDHGNGLEGWYNVREKLRGAIRAIGGEA